jgi:natural product biosynthesis luciferase-like monooxygenase protein
MLYHHLSAPQSGVDVEQMVMTLRECLDAEALRAAWDSLVNRHAAFRCSFDWESSHAPMQVEHSEVALQWEQQDLRGVAPEARRRSVSEYLDRDRKRGFDLRVAPVTRAALLQIGNNEWEFIWSFHHILADGQTYPALIREGFSWYDAIRAGKELTLPEPPSIQEYGRWREARLAESRSRAEVFWRATLAGFTAPTPLPGAGASGDKHNGWGEKSIRLSGASSTALSAFAQAHRLSMNNLVQGAWAFALGVHGGGDDVVFGVTRACRRSERAGIEDVIGVLINTVPVRVRIQPAARVTDWLLELRASNSALREFEHTPLVDVQRWSGVPAATPLFESIVVFTPRLVGSVLKELGGPWEHREVRFLEQTNYPLTLFAYNESQLLLKIAYDRARCGDATIDHFLDLMKTFLEALPAHAGATLAEMPLLDGPKGQKVLLQWNDTSREYAREHCIHELFEIQAERTPDAVAVVFRDRSLTYRELNRRANQVARRLASLGARPGRYVGVFLKRSIDLVTALLGTLKAGAAYVPMDPAYPQERLRWMLEDCSASVVLTERDLADAIPAQAAPTLCLDDDGMLNDSPEDPANVQSGVRPDGVAYVIFTSGSSGRPKGVMVEHRNVTNFFAGMDACLDFEEPGTWLAVTSVSFDISVLELFWTLARGFKVVIQEEAGRTAPAGDPVRPDQARKMDFSLFYFAADAGGPGENRYRLLLEGARFADQHGFAAVWTPERHFHAFGGLYPNPSVTSAAIAALTSRIQIRAGSVVLPLHDPIRVAEEWSVVDNLSQGRVGLSFASGWHANDFALMPQNYRDRKDVMVRGIDTIRRLWRGEAVKARSGSGDEIEVRIFPAPFQREPQIWVTAAGNVETFRMAGQMGANLLTNLLGQKVEELADKITAYRDARRAHNHPGPGHVSLMLHTFVGPDLEDVRRKVRKPFLDYLKTSTDLIKKARWECPAFATAPGRRIESVDDSQLTESETEMIMDHAFERYFQSSGLFGTPDMCLQMVDRLKAIGVDEIACLIDFGVDCDSVLESLRHLDLVRSRSNLQAAEADYAIERQLRRHQVTHLQCTPSLARILASEAGSLEALRPVRKLLLGGEALPAALAAVLAPALDGDLLNMYGPTETTVWSSVARIGRAGGPITIGRPIANTRIYIVDRHLRPVPIGVPGELVIGGEGVTRGYLNRPDLTAEKYIPDPFCSAPGARLYRTGDLARYLEDGQIEFLGRLDNQVKLRGYRIELGEVESVLQRHPAVFESAVVTRENAAGEKELIAYVGARRAPSSSQAAVSDWRTLWDDTYERASEAARGVADPTLNISGWVSSYTGELIPELEMREWVEHTVGRLLHHRPRRVLEIGCGTGMLLLRIAPHCEHYHGVDFSASAVTYVAAEAARRGLENVTLEQASAHELSGLADGSFDLVILNSVSQYFPDADYLAAVLKRVSSLVTDGGSIFLGDVRSRPLNEAFHASVELERAPAYTSATELRRRVRSRLERETELVVDPTFFRVLSRHLPRFQRPEIHLKRGRHHNEMTCFRYDVLLGRGGSNRGAPPPRFECGQNITASLIRERLLSANEVLAFAGIPNPRVARAVEAARLLASDACPETAGEIRLRLGATPAPGIDPEDLYALDVPWELESSWSDRSPELYDAVFRPRDAAPHWPDPGGAEPPVGDGPWSRYTNTPAAQTLGASLALELKVLAREQLAEFMLPAAIVVLDALPRTPNGKIDRKALPAPDREPQRTATPFAAPQTEMEMTIAEVWRELLNLERVGTHDNFFDLGANSLIMVQASSRLRAALRKEFSLVDLFRFPTISALAQRLSQNGEDQSALRQSQERGRARIDVLERRRMASRSGPAPAQVR